MGTDTEAEARRVLERIQTRLAATEPEKRPVIVSAGATSYLAVDWHQN